MMAYLNSYVNLAKIVLNFAWAQKGMAIGEVGDHPFLGAVIIYRRKVFFLNEINS